MFGQALRPGKRGGWGVSSRSLISGRRQGQIGTPRLVKTIDAPYDEEERQGLDDLIQSFSDLGA